MRESESTLIIIPAFNAGRTLAELLQRLSAEYPALPVLVVDDGSADRTAQIALDAGVSLISNTFNRGKGDALADGFRWARGQGFSTVVTMDADLQHDPADLAGLLEAQTREPGAITVGARLINWKTTPWPRVISNRFSSFLLSLFSGTCIPDAQSGYRVLPLSSTHSQPKERGYMFEAETLLSAAKRDLPINCAPARTVYRDERSHMKPGIETLRFLRTLWRGLWY